MHNDLAHNYNQTTRRSMTIYTNEAAPALTIPTLSGDTFTLSEQNLENYTIVVFYRGLHCPICINQLKEIEANFEQAKK